MYIQAPWVGLTPEEDEERMYGRRHHTDYEDGEEEYEDEEDEE